MDNFVVDYHKEAKELREFKVTANLLEEDQTKLKGELASLKGELYPEFGQPSLKYRKMSV